MKNTKCPTGLSEPHQLVYLNPHNPHPVRAEAMKRWDMHLCGVPMDDYSVESVAQECAVATAALGSDMPTFTGANCTSLEELNNILKSK